MKVESESSKPRTVLHDRSYLAPLEWAWTPAEVSVRHVQRALAVSPDHGVVLSAELVLAQGRPATSAAVVANAFTQRERWDLVLQGVEVECRVVFPSLFCHGLVGLKCATPFFCTFFSFMIVNNVFLNGKCSTPGRLQ